MAGTRKNQSDFESRYFDLIQSGLGRLEEKLDETNKHLEDNTALTQKVKEQAEKTNGRVNKLESEVFGKVKPSDLPPIYRDPKVISIVFNISLAILVLVIAATKVDVSGLIP